MDYSPIYAEFNVVSSIGAFAFGLSHLLFLWIIIKAVRGGKQAEAKPWGGAQIGTPGLEWTLPSPPPFHSFTDTPVVK